MALTPPKPMMALASETLPVGPLWTYEVKWDGYRTIAVKDGPRVRLFSRNLKDVTARYPAVARLVAATAPRVAILDGEVVALDEHGRPSFQALQHHQAHALAFYAFDLLHLGGLDLMRAPLAERRAKLTGIAAGTSLLVSDPLPGTPRQIERAVRRLGLEGLVAKRADSRYEPGRRSGAWTKVRFSARQELVVGGYRPADDSLDSVLVGYFDAGQLRYAAGVRAGFTPRTRALVRERLKGLETSRCPFGNLPTQSKGRWGEGITAEDMAAFRWVKPSLVIEVSFTEWTRQGSLRHPAFQGIRDDKLARDVRREIR
jgi:bifunctional non-homologous end joining protein LigD